MKLIKTIGISAGITVIVASVGILGALLSNLVREYFGSNMAIPMTLLFMFFAFCVFFWVVE